MAAGGASRVAAAMWASREREAPKTESTGEHYIVDVIIGVAWPHTNREHKLSADPHRSPTGAKKPGPCSMKGWSQDMADTATNGHSGAP